VQLKAAVILVTDQCDPNLVKSFYMEHAYTLSEALDRAFKLTRADAEVTVVPDGVGVIVKETPVPA